MSNISFPNQNHRSTEPLVAGSLEKKGKLLKKYEASFWVITPAKYMHEYKTDDDFAKDPVPETSLYLPDCMIGALDGQKFMVKGKDVSGSSFGNKLSMAHEYAFKAHTPQDAAKWYEALRGATGSQTNELPSTSPVASRQPSAAMGPVSTEEPTKVFAEEDTRPQTTETAALDAEKREAAYAAAGPTGPTDTVAHTRV